MSVAGMLWSQPTPLIKEKANTAEITKPLEVSAINQVRYANYYADSGDGTSGTPWADWCDALSTGVQVIFPAGYYLADQTCTLDSNEWIDCAEGARFERDAGANALQLFATNATAESNIRITGCTFDTNGLAVTEQDIEIDSGSSYIYITDNKWVGLDADRTAALTQVESADAGTHSSYIWHMRNQVIADTTLPNPFATNTFQVFTASHVYFFDNYVYSFGAFKIEQDADSTTTMTDIQVERNQFIDVDQTHVFMRTHNSNAFQDVSCSFNTASTTLDHVKGLCEIGGITNDCTPTPCSGSQGTFCSDGTTNCLDDADCTGIGDETCRIGTQQNVRMIGNTVQGHNGPMLKLCDAGQVCKADGFVIADNVLDGRDPGGTSTEAASVAPGIRVSGRLADGNETKHGTISGNTVQYTASSGIEVVNSQFVNIASNTVAYANQIDIGGPDSDDPDDKGAITVYSGCDEITIQGNQVVNVGNATVGASYSLWGIRVDDLSGGGGIDVVGNRIIDDRGTPQMDYGIRFGEAGASIDDVSVVANRVIGAISGEISTQGTVDLYKAWNLGDDTDTDTEINRAIVVSEDHHIDVGSADCSAGAPIECYVYAQEGMGIGAVPAASGQLRIRGAATVPSTIDFDYDPGVTGPIGGTGLVLSVGADDELKLLKGGATSQTIARFRAQSLLLGRDDTSQNIDLIFSGSNETLAWEKELGSDAARTGFTVTDPLVWSKASGTHYMIQGYNTTWPPEPGAYMALTMSGSTTSFQAYAMSGYTFDVGQATQQFKINNSKYSAFTAFMYGQLNALGQGTCSTTTSTACWEDGDCPGGEHCDNGMAAIYEGSIQTKAEGNPPVSCSAGNAGAIYYDSDNAGMCFCDGSNWLEVTDGTTACN